MAINPTITIIYYIETILMNNKSNPSEIKKRSVNLGGHKTSVSLENIFWDHIKKQAAELGITVNQLLTDIDRDRLGNLSSAARVFVLDCITRENR